MLAALSLTWAAASPSGTSGGGGQGGGAAGAVPGALPGAVPGAVAAEDLLCQGRLEADTGLLAGHLPAGPGCSALTGGAASLQERWEGYYAPGVLENASDPSQFRRLLLGRFMAFHPVRTWMEVGPFTPADLEVVHDHWLGFPPTSPSVHYILAAAYTVIMTLGVFGNLLVLYMFCRSVSSVLAELLSDVKAKQT
ncbi:hypothetical protein KUF71_025219, partial [Frankliniella fusca]